ncbi:MAG: hypothetical protein M1840_007440 [Geoglossum simile]|nr:MAG: hypothetical protein M1840_007440 [Geoglossum simile]
MASEQAELVASIAKLVEGLNSDALHSICDTVNNAIALQQPDPYKKKTLAASTLEIGAVIEMLGIDYWRDDLDYAFELKGNEAQDTRASDWCLEAIRKFNTSRYYSFRREPFSRTLIHLLLCDRLLVLGDGDANNILEVATEVDIRAEVLQNKKGKWKAGYITGRADYTLGYLDRRKIEAILIIIEAKKEGAGGLALPQTLCYLAGVQDARKKAGKINVDLFGMISDGSEYRFIHLDCKRKAWVSRPLMWGFDAGRIVAFLDHILQSAVSSSPHTAPVKTKNKQVRNYSGYLDDTFKRGEGSSAQKEDLKLKEDMNEYDVIEKDVSRLGLSESVETKRD